ncbi:TetR/AcrR family transcriptional regulator [Conexibacter sp. DBS9H8]|uniref:TetR/AcrR family transcriptional regulator n=1 Tax=Conexibacter sp. DBS9H8 TaxID=2937801 RepID=UPI00201097D6|nr:TetR/AcrR family transcriptional regulator [Conexibacter sp. DBS9H8]
MPATEPVAPAATSPGGAGPVGDPVSEPGFPRGGPAGQPASGRGDSEPTPRERLIAALAEAIVERGYAETTVADIVARARTSRRTFYEHFRDRGGCFLALFAQETARTLAAIAAAIDLDDDLAEQAERAVDAYIAAVSVHPELQRSFARELPGLAEAGAEAVRAVTGRYADLFVDLVEVARSRRPDPPIAPLHRDVAVILISGLRELLVSATQEGRPPSAVREPSLAVVRAIVAALLRDA